MGEELRSASELMAMEFEPRRWLVGGLLPAGGLVAISGGSNSGKTWIGLELALDFALGKAFLGQGFEEKGAALLLCHGENLQGIAERLMALGKGKGVEVPKEIYFDQRYLDLSREEEAEQVAEMVQQTGCSLLIIDNFRLYLPRSAEYSGYWVRRALRNLRGLCEEKGLCCVILQGHERAFNLKAGRYERPSKDLSVLFGQSDLVVDLSEEDGLRRLTVVKNRLAEERLRLNFRIFCEADEGETGMVHLVLIGRAEKVGRARKIADEALGRLKKFLKDHLGEQFKRTELIEALGKVMPVPRERNLNEAFAVLGKNPNIEISFDGKEKIYQWREGFFGYGAGLDAGMTEKDILEALTARLDQLGREVERKASLANAGSDG